MTKRCSKCGFVKPKSDFHSRRSAKDGLRGECKSCGLGFRKKYRNTDKYRKDAAAAAREYYKTDKCKATKAAYRLTDKYKAGRTAYRKTDERREYEAAYKRVYRRTERGRELKKRYRDNLLAIPKDKINHCLRTAIGRALKGTKNGRSWERLVGYNAETLIKHLEKLFLPGMAWANMGKWHVDHKIPKSVFNFTTADDIDFKRCWALENLQPLWAEDNRRKKDKLDKPFQPSFSFGGMLNIEDPTSSDLATKIPHTYTEYKLGGYSCQL